MAAGDITYTNPSGRARDGAFASGTIALDVSEIMKIYCGFKPSKIVLYVKDTGATTIDQIITWVAGMTAGAYWSALNSTGAVTVGTSGGPTVLEDTTGQGFQIPAGFPSGGADSDVVVWEAWR